MNSFRKALGWSIFSCLLGIALFLVGCGTMNPSPTAAKDGSQTSGEPIRSVDNKEISGASDVLRPGDVVIVTFSGASEAPPRHEDKIREDGKITLPFIGDVVAAGQTRAELQSKILGFYVPKYFLRLTVNVNADLRYYSVAGEVRGPNRFPYSGRVTVLSAIASAGDFTDFAKKTAVEVTRANGRTITVNCNKAQRDPSLDISIYPDDRVFVPRRLF